MGKGCVVGGTAVWAYRFGLRIQVCIFTGFGRWAYGSWVLAHGLVYWLDFVEDALRVGLRRVPCLVDLSVVGFWSSGDGLAGHMSDRLLPVRHGMSDRLLPVRHELESLILAQNERWRQA